MGQLRRPSAQDGDWQGRSIPSEAGDQLRWNDGKPEVQLGYEPPKVYDLVGAYRRQFPDLKLFENLGFNYQRPKIVKTFITEFPFGADSVKHLFGSSMHVFLLNLSRLDFAALIPKGDYVTLCLGTNIDKELIRSFFDHPEVKRCFPPGWSVPADACRCSPKMSGAAKPGIPMRTAWC